MEVKQGELTQEIWDDWGALMRNQECAECGAGLTIHTIPERAAMALSCSADHNHSGFRQRTCLTEEYRRGAEVYPAVKDKIEAKTMVKTELQRAMNLLALRFPDAIKDVPGAALFVNDCMRLGLDPLIQPAEAVPIPFRCKIKDRDGRGKPGLWLLHPVRMGRCQAEPCAGRQSSRQPSPCPRRQTLGA